MPVGVKDVDKAMARTLNVVVLCRVLFRVGDEKIAIDALDAERRIAGRDIGIDEPSIGCCRGKEPVGAVGPKHVDRACIKIGREEEKAMDVDAVSKALVDSATCGIVEGNDRVGRIRSESPGPSG
jgi:hypothetical protein